MRLLEFFEDVDEANETIYQACEGIIDPEVFRANLSPEDLDHIERGAISAEQLRSFAEMMTARLTRERGEVPEGWTAATCCRQCGEVAIWPGCPSAVQGCPWCHAIRS